MILAEQLPIISTRKAHLTIDQRVWDSEQPEFAKNNSFPAELKNVATLHDQLASQSPDDSLNPGSDQQL